MFFDLSRKEKDLNINLKQFKKTRFLFTLMICIATILIISMSLSYAAIDENKAEDLIYQYCEEQLGYSKEELELYNFIPQKGSGWSFSLKVKEADATTKGVITGELTGNGQLVKLEHQGNISVFEQILEDLRRSERSYEAMYQFKQKWAYRLSQLSDIELTELDKNKAFPFKAFVNHDIRLPSAQDISYEQAKMKAEKAILELPGWTQEMLDHIRVKLEVYHIPVQGDRPVYQFVYDEASEVGYIEAMFSGNNYSFNYEKLSKAERKVFGDVRLNAVSVRIDAQTGELVGEIHVQLVPDFSGDPIVLILRE